MEIINPAILKYKNQINKFIYFHKNIYSYEKRNKKSREISNY